MSSASTPENEKQVLPPNNSRVFVIAEAGVNHNGDLELAKKLIDVALDARADAVKFQTWKRGEISGSFAFKVDYQEQTSPSSESCFSISACSGLKIYSPPVISPIFSSSCTMSIGLLS